MKTVSTLKLIAASCFMLLLLVSGTLASVAASSRPLSVYVSIEPQAFFVERIGGARISVGVLVKAGANPATYSLTPAQMGQLAKSGIYFRIGLPFEKILLDRIKRFANGLTIVNTWEGIPLRTMDAGGHHHGHDDQEDLGLEGKDPHTWLNPLHATIQAGHILKALVSADPAGESTYLENYRAFVVEMEALDRSIRALLAPVKGGTMYVFHPSFGYFADAYGLKQAAVETEGKAPRGKELSLLIKKARKEGVRVIFVQPQFDRHAAAKIASAIDGVVIPLNPLAADYTQNLREIASKVLKALSSNREP